MSKKHQPVRANGRALTIPAAARELNFSPYSLRRACDRGEVKIIDLGGTRRIPAGEVARLRQMLSDAK